MRFKSKQEALKAHENFWGNRICENALALPRLQMVLDTIPPKSKVLDVGCNDGQFGKMMIDLKDCEVSGVDISSEIIKEARRNGLKVYMCEIEKMPFDDNTFDVVTASETLEHIFDIHEALKEIKRVLKPNGKLVGTVPHPDIENLDDEDYHCNSFTRDSLKEILEGFFGRVTVKNVMGVLKFVGKGQHLFFEATKCS